MAIQAQTFLGHTQIDDPVYRRDQLQRAAEKGEMTPIQYYRALRAAWSVMTCVDKHQEYNKLNSED